MCSLRLHTVHYYFGLCNFKLHTCANFTEILPIFVCAATTQENVFSLGLEKTPKPAGELLKEAANTIRERQPSLIQQRVLRNRKIPTQDLKQYQRNSKRIKKKANEEEMAAVPEVEEDRMAEVAEEDDGTMRNDVKGSEVIERLEGEKKNKVLEYFNTHPKT